jgi:hypothetical protein
MDTPKDSASGRVFGEKPDKFPTPESSPDQLNVDTESAVRNKTSDQSLVRIDGQTAEEITYSQRSALRTLPGMVPFKARFECQSLIESL